MGKYTCSGSSTCQLPSQSSGSGGSSETPAGSINLGAIGVQPVWFVIVMCVVIGMFLCGVAFAIYRRGPCFSRGEEDPTERKKWWNVGNKRRESSTELEIVHVAQNRKDGDATPFTPGTFLGEPSGSNSERESRSIDHSTRRSSLRHDDVPRLSLGSLPRKKDPEPPLPVIGAPGTLLGSIGTMPKKEQHIDEKEFLPSFGGPGTLLGNLALNREPSKQSGHSHQQPQPTSQTSQQPHTHNSLPRSLDRRSRKSTRTPLPDSDSDEDSSRNHLHVSGGASRKPSLGSGGGAAVTGGLLGSGVVTKSGSIPTGSVVQIEDVALSHDEMRNLTMRSHRSRNSEGTGGRRLSAGSAGDAFSGSNVGSAVGGGRSGSVVGYSDGIPPPPDYTINKDIFQGGYVDAVSNSASSFDRVGAWVNSLERRKGGGYGDDMDAALPPLHPQGSGVKRSNTTHGGVSSGSGGHARQPSPSVQGRRSNSNMRGYSPSKQAGAGSVGYQDQRGSSSGPHRRPSNGRAERSGSLVGNEKSSTATGLPGGTIGVIHSSGGAPSLGSGFNNGGVAAAKRADSSSRQRGGARGGSGVRGFDDDANSFDAIISGFDQQFARRDVDEEEVGHQQQRKGGAGKTTLRDGRDEGVDGDDDDAPLQSVVGAASAAAAGVNASGNGGSLPRGRKRSLRKPSSSQQGSRPPSPLATSSNADDLINDMELAAGYITSTSNASTSLSMATTLQNKSTGSSTRQPQQPQPQLPHHHHNPSILTRPASKTNLTDPTPTLSPPTSTVSSPVQSSPHTSAGIIKRSSKKSTAVSKIKTSRSGGGGGGLGHHSNPSSPAAPSPPLSQIDDASYLKFSGSLPRHSESRGSLPRSLGAGSQARSSFERNVAANEFENVMKSGKHGGGGGRKSESAPSSPKHPRVSAKSSSRRDSRGKGVVVNDDEDDEDEGLPLASIALANLQKSIGGK
ncbi:hypothetical protein HDU97_010361 [Phlyctochytrium planicorne]|nr:hypothetical protein HDU97_010361 [Phlyctochytrium planicorne]